MVGDGCRHYRRVQLGKSIRLACLRGLYGEWLQEEPVDGARLALALGFGFGRVFDRAVERCQWWGK